MRILSICPDTGIDVLGPKGAAVHVREMAAAFVRLDHDVEIVAPRLQSARAKADRLAPETTAARLHHVPVPALAQDAKAALAGWSERVVPGSSLAKDVRRVLYDDHLIGWLRRYEADPPDVIYVRASALSTAGAELARHTGRPLVVEVNAPLHEEQQRYRAGALGPVYRHAEAALLTAADVVAVVSEALCGYVVGLGVDPERILVLPNGVDPRRFHPAAAAPSEPVLGFVGGLRPWHGVDLLPDVLAGVRRRVPGARLVIVGDGPMRPRIEARAAELGVADAVTFTGAVSHERVPALVRGFSVAVAPYPELEHDFYFSPLKLAEYLACGVPVVASALGEIVTRFASVAVLTPPGDVHAAAAACADLLENPGAAAARGGAGAALVRSRYTWDANARRVLAAAGAGVR